LLKKTIIISNPSFLKKHDEQLVIDQGEQKSSIPIEDIGLLLLDHWQVTITQGCISAILANDGIIISCDKSHHPDGIMLPVSGNAVHAETLRAQVECSVPFRKQLWQQTIKTKILNQAALLEQLSAPLSQSGRGVGGEGRTGVGGEALRHFAVKVRSGDPNNLEGRAAAYYWKNLFSADLKFKRERFGEPPNNLLNYGYALLRASVARGVVCAGLHPALGIHHRNRYNAFCLADDLMEPYRPFVDAVVRNIVMPLVPLAPAGREVGLPAEGGGEGQFGNQKSEIENLELTPDLKKQLLVVLGNDVLMEGERKPLQLAVGKTCASLAQCLRKEANKILYPEFCPSSDVPSFFKEGGGEVETDADPDKVGTA
jgi:CRISPR-associated protein Cas1